MKKTLLFALAIFLFSASVQSAESWNIKTPMPVALNASAAVCIDSFIYVIGGVNTSGTGVSSMYAYNVYTDSWSSRAPMATVRNDFFAAAVNGKIYAIGGYNASVGALSVVEEYDPATDTWTTKAPMPTPRSLFSGAAIGTKIYVTAGWPATYAVHEVYDVVTNTWSTKAPLSLGKLQLNGGAAMGGKFYLVGGKNYANTAFYDSCIIYDPAVNSWSVGPNPPVARFSGGTTYFHGRIYHMGGGQGYFAVPNFNNNVYLDSATNTWNTALPCLAKRSYALAVSAPNNKIYLVGGLDSAGHAVNWNHEYTTDMIFPTDTTGGGDTTTGGGDTTTTFAHFASKGSQLSVFPNPSHGTCSVALPTGLPGNTPIDVAIVDALGRISRRKTTAVGRVLQVDVADLPQGKYNIMLETAGKRYTGSVVITPGAEY